MSKKYRVPVLFVFLVALAGSLPAAAQSSQLGRALNDMYVGCLFGEQGPFGQAASLSSDALAPGLSAFIENNLSAIPLTPPQLELDYQEGQIVTAVTGFTPIFTESSATVGKGHVFFGSNFTYSNLSRIRGRDLSDLQFGFAQDNPPAGRDPDVIAVQMPLDVSASVLTLYGTYGITNRLDVGVALPFVRFTVASNPTVFQVLGTNTGCRYGAGCGADPNEGSDRVLYTLAGDSVTINIPNVAVVRPSPTTSNFKPVPESEAYLSTIVVRAKYRFPLTLNVGSVAALLDVRIPAGRTSSDVLGEGSFGARLTLIGEYDRIGGFKPYVNVGGQYWDGDTNTNGLRLAAGFNQRVGARVFFAFDLLGKIDLETAPLLAQIAEPAADPTGVSSRLVFSNLPANSRDHALLTGLGLQVVFSESFYAYGSALFSLLDSGLQATIAPTAGFALHL